METNSDVAFCGLYCGACKKLMNGACPGCAKNAKASWCKVRSCCLEHGYSSCAACTQFQDPNECGKFNNFIARAFGLIFNSDRRACILRIRDVGTAAFATEMAKQQRQSLPRR